MDMLNLFILLLSASDVIVLQFVLSILPVTKSDEKAGHQDISEPEQTVNKTNTQFMRFIAYHFERQLT